MILAPVSLPRPGPGSGGWALGADELDLAHSTRGKRPGLLARARGARIYKHRPRLTARKVRSWVDDRLHRSGHGPASGPVPIEATGPAAGELSASRQAGRIFSGFCL
jgi:hypothetical protein